MLFSKVRAMNPSIWSLLVLGLLASSCGPDAVRPSLGSSRDASIDTRLITEVRVVPKLRVGDRFIWGYYPGSGAAPRMYEAYLKLPDRAARPTFALLTMFPDESPAGVWVLHDGMAFDHDQWVEELKDPGVEAHPPLQMFGWDEARQAWFASTRHPNTFANEEKLNFRGRVSRDPSLAWQTRFGCYDGRELLAIDDASGGCAQGEVVFQQVPRDRPPYVFLPYYSLATGLTVYKLFNEAASDPDSRVAMRLVYAQDAHGERQFREADDLHALHLAAFQEVASAILRREGAL
jgi:hypothetical protein